MEDDLAAGDAVFLRIVVELFLGFGGQCFTGEEKLQFGRFARIGCLVVYVSLFVPSPYCFDYCISVIWFKIRKCDASSFIIFQDSSGYSRSFVVPYEF